MKKTEIFSELVSGVVGGYVTDVSQVRNAVARQEVKTVNKVSLFGSGDVNTNFTSLTYQQLLKLKNDGLLIPGMHYCITNYQASCAIGGTVASILHQYYIIVEATTNKTLNEEAKLTNYDKFAVESWKVKYCIDNDTSRFNWAVPDKKAGATCNGVVYIRNSANDKTVNNVYYRAFENDGAVIYSTRSQPTTGDIVYVDDYFEGIIDNGVFQEWFDGEINGRGVIYYMQDEFGNEAPYDFKHILIDSKYTFGGDTDDSLLGQSVGNKIGTYYDSSGKQSINGIVLGRSCHHNIFKSGCSNIVLGDSCDCNTFDCECNNIVLENTCSYNVFANACKGIACSSDCGRNQFANGCANITLNGVCDHNVFDAECSGITLGQMSTRNFFGKRCSSMELTGSSNVFGVLCRDNTFSTGFQYNTLGDACISNTFSGSVSFATLGKYCCNNTIKAGRFYHVKSGTIGQIIDGTEVDNNSLNYPLINHGIIDTTFELTPNAFHLWGEVTELTLDFSDGKDSIVNEYIFQFYSGDTATMLTLPDSIMWSNGVIPTIESNMVYQFRIVNKCATFMRFPINTL